MMSKQTLASLFLATVSAGVLAQEIPPDVIDYVQEKAWEYEQGRVEQKSTVTPQALVSGNLLLRDAHYRYHEDITVPEGDEIIFVALECDIYQLVLTVLEGSVTLVTIEAEGMSDDQLIEGLSFYPDKLGVGAGMFAYTLYSNNPWKSFVLKNGDYVGDDAAANVTAFGYCFSTKMGADSAFANTHGDIFD